MPQVCRTCLEEIPDVNCIRLNNSSFKIKEELHVCLPEVDVELVPDAVMCIYCVNELHSCYDFKQKCLFTEKQIRTQLHSQAAIDLAELKKDSELELLNGNGEGSSADTDAAALSEGMQVASLDRDVEMCVNGNPVEESLESESQNSIDDEDDDDEDINASNLVLGLCESAPRKHPPMCSTSQAPTSTPPTNSISPSVKQEIVRGARKSTTKGPQVVITPIYKKKSSQLPKFTCLICSASSTTITDYIAHTKNTHKGENHNYKCSQCAFNSKAPNSLIRHYDNHSKDLPAPNTGSQNASHMKASFKCPHCDFEVSNISVLNKHIDTHILKCSKCYYIATSRVAYQKHMSTHSLTLESDDVVVIEDEEDIPCNRCKYIAKGTTQFEKHCLALHGIQYPYACKECGYTTGKKAALTKHLKFHVGQRMFQCSICTYNCDLLYNLNKHLANRHNQK